MIAAQKLESAQNYRLKNNQNLLYNNTSGLFSIDGIQCKIYNRTFNKILTPNRVFYECVEIPSIKFSFNTIDSEDIGNIENIMTSKFSVKINK